MNIGREDAKWRLRASEEMFLAVSFALDNGAVLLDGRGEVVAVNPAAEKILGIAAADLIGRSASGFAQTIAFINEDRTPFHWEHHPTVLTLRTGQAPASVLVGMRRADGKLRWLSIGARPLRSDGDSEPPAIVTTVRDITESRMAEQFERFRTRMLERLSGGASLQEVLDGIALGVEQLRPEMICGILLADSECKRFIKGFGPSLPAFYTAAIEHLEIAVGVGSCGTAAATGERVIVEDIQAHPHWAIVRELAAKAGLAACWSEPIHSSSGQVLGAFAVYHREAYSPEDIDISIIEKSTRLASIAIERMRMEDELQRREREHRSLVQNSPDTIFRYDRNFRRLFVHKGSAGNTGGPIESLLGSTPADNRVLVDNEAKKMMDGIRRVFDTATPVSIHLDIVDDHGRHRGYEMHLAPELDEHGNVATVLSLGRDITAIRDAERQMTQFVANLPGFAFAYQRSPDGHGTMPFVSLGVEKLFGLKPEDLRHDIAPLLAVAHPDDVPRIMATIDESVRTMAPFRVEARAARPGAPMRWGELRAVPVRQVDGSVLWHGIMLDIDRRKRYEAELEQHRHHLEKLVEERTLALSVAKESAEAATRAKSHFLAAASHDLRQPLQAIRLFNDVLAMSGLSEQQQRIGHSLSKAVNSLSELFNDLLDLSRLEAGTIEPRPTVIQAEDLIAMVGTEFDAIFHEKKLRLHLFWPRQSLALFSDSTLLQTMLRNLISNAVKYTQRGGVMIAIRRRGERALIQVWDTGIGIAEEKFESVFEEYFQIGNPEGDRAKGVGLGLAIVKRLSRLLGIEVRLRSREGKGSVFELYVPLARISDIRSLPKHPQESPASATPAHLPGKRIMIIEDDPTIAEAIKLSLEVDGADVTLFATAEDALASEEIQEADFYISDYRLPGMNGLQLLDTLQRNSVDPIKAVVLTGNTAPDQVATLQASPWQVLFKPVRIPQLLSALNGNEAMHCTPRVRYSGMA
jgi:PAS domain S-box-containing protein